MEESLSEVQTIWSAELRRTLKSARVVTLLLLYLMFTALVLLGLAYFFGRAQVRIDEQMALSGATPEQLAPQLDQLKKSFIGGMFSEDAALLEALAKVPLIILLTFKITLFFLPLYVAVMGFDQVSGELGPRSIRYLAVRSRRTSILTGKFLAQASLLAGLMLVVDLAMLAVARWVSPGFGASVMATTLAKCWIAAGVFSLSYVGLTTLCSTLFRSPAVSLVFNLFALLGFWLMNSAGEAAHRGVTQAATQDEPASKVLLAVSWLRFASPSHYSTNLLHPELLEFIAATSIYVAFTAAFLLISYVALQRRDL